MFEWLGDSAIPDPPEGSPSLTLSPPSPPTIPSPNRGERQAQPSSCKPLLWVTRRLPLRPRLYSSMGGSSGEGRAPRDGAGRTANAGPSSEARRVPSSPGRCRGVGGNAIRLEADSTSNSLGWLLSKKKRKRKRNPEHSVGENVGKLDPRALPVGMQNGAAAAKKWDRSSENVTWNYRMIQQARLRVYIQKHRKRGRKETCAHPDA